MQVSRTCKAKRKRTVPFTLFPSSRPLIEKYCGMVLIGSSAPSGGSVGSCQFGSMRRVIVESLHVIMDRKTTWRSSFVQGMVMHVFWVFCHGPAFDCRHKSRWRLLWTGAYICMLANIRKIPAEASPVCWAPWGTTARNPVIV